MLCPNCSHDDSKVIDSRDAGAGIRRRRECLECDGRFTTYEQVQVRELMVVKRDGRREDLDREKLIAGVTKACAKRPLPTGSIDKLVQEIELAVVDSGRREVSSEAIGQLVMEKLKEMDRVAYISTRASTGTSRTWRPSEVDSEPPASRGGEQAATWKGDRPEAPAPMEGPKSSRKPGGRPRPKPLLYLTFVYHAYVVDPWQYGKRNRAPWLNVAQGHGSRTTWIADILREEDLIAGVSAPRSLCPAEPRQAGAES